jgi:hypothetical protein
MGLFGFGRKDKVIDLSQTYGKKSAVSKENPPDSLSAFSAPAEMPQASEQEEAEQPETEEEKRKKLAKRLVDISTKLDEISMQIYHLQQRVELLERKMGIKTGA